MNEHKKVIAEIKKGNLKPLYFLSGEEPYFIDLIADYIAENVLTEEEKGFNQSVLYGRDVTVDEVVASAKRFPMMAEHQVVILKEAQDLARRMNDFEAYFNNPQPSTVLVICYKYKKVDKRKKFYKAAKKNGVVYETPRIYENKIPAFIQELLKGKGYSITNKATAMLTEFLGTDLGKINNEVEKLELIVPKSAKITPEIIEENIGISKDYNNFELQNALGENDFKRAFQIIDYFGKNPKDHSILATLPLLYRYFTNLLKYHGLGDKSQRNVASKLGVHPFFVKDYVKASRVFSMKKCSYAVKVLRDIDTKTKGVNASSNLTQADLLKELLVKIAR